MEIIRLSITPSANRNSFRVAISFYILTQGSVLRPQPLGWENATPTELLLVWSCYALGMMPIKSCLSPDPASITSINHKSITHPSIRHNYHP